MTQNHFDLIVIGSGPAGEVGAIRAAQLGLKVALIEKQAHLGGTCLNWGCIPTKALLESAKQYDKFKHAEELGFGIGKLSYHWDVIMKRKETVVDQQRKGLRFLMKKNKIEVFEGHGRLKDKNTVTVSPSAGGTVTSITAKSILLCMGSRVRELPFAKANGKGILNSDSVLSIDSIPESLCIIGGGVVGMEFASLFGRFGSQVTVIEVGAQILPSEDEEVVKDFERLVKKQNVSIECNQKVSKIDDQGSKVEVTTEDGKKRSFSRVLVSVGREPVSQDCGLEGVGVKMDRGFVVVDDHYKTNIPNIFAVGDLIPTPALAHTASAEALHAVEIIAGHHPTKINYKANPSAIYTYPEVASIGDTEKTLKTKGIAYKSTKFPFAPMAKAKIEGATDGFIKILYDPKYRELLGVHIINARATEMIAEFALGKNLETTVDEIGSTIHPHPTLSETIMEAAHAAVGGAIHM